MTAALLVLIVVTIASFFGPVWMRACAARQERGRQSEDFWRRAAFIDRLRKEYPL